MNNSISNDRFTAQPGDIHIITNDELQCCDCEYRIDKSGICEKYGAAAIGKPKQVFDKSADCKHYIKKH